MTSLAYAPEKRHLHRVRAWRGFARITAAEEIPFKDATVAAPAWTQAEFRTECGTGCCYAGHVAIENGGRWLVSIRLDGAMFIDDQPLADLNDHPLRWTVWEYMLAEPGDPQEHVEEAFDKRLIHVSYRAERLLGYPYRCGDLFDASNTKLVLERLITDRFGPSPTLVGGTAKQDA